MELMKELKDHTPAEALKALRDMRGLTLRELEEATRKVDPRGIGIDRTMISGHEHGHKGISMPSAELYAMALSTPENTVPRSVFGWPMPGEKDAADAGT